MASKRRIRRKTCGTKKRHASIADAWLHIRDLYRNGEGEGKRPTIRLAPYYCPWCKGVHVGHRTRGPR